MAFKIDAIDNVSYEDNVLSNVNQYGISEDFRDIQQIDIAYGRYITASEFEHGNPVMVIGNEVAEKLFISPEIAVGKMMQVRGKKLEVVGVIKKQGKSMFGGWQFDQSVIIPYKFARNIIFERNGDPVILVQGKDNLKSVALKDDLKGNDAGYSQIKPHTR